MSRTVLKHTRIYIGGYDSSPYTGTVGPLTQEFGECEFAALSDDVKNVLPNQANITPGTLNGVFDNTATSGLHILMNDAGGKNVVSIPIGFRAAPAAGDPVFCGEFEQMSYTAEPGDTCVTATIDLGRWSNTATSKAYDKPWGHLLHANAAATAANSATGAGVDGGASSSAGGFFVYHVTSGDGTATLSVDDSADDSSYTALSDATSGELDCSSVQSGIVALATDATVRQYLRWQISLNSAETVTFVSSFVRG